MGDHPLILGGHNYIDLRTQDVKINVADAAQAVPDAVSNAPVPTQTNASVADRITASRSSSRTSSR